VLMHLSLPMYDGEFDHGGGGGGCGGPAMEAAEDNLSTRSHVRHPAAPKMG